jgi:tetratricopeptide (TPR) repeat protein
MSELADTDLIEAEGGDRFRFAHALIQDVAYESLLYSRRRKLHERAGSYFEVMHWQNPAPVYETLVYHYVRAGNRPRALLYSVLAGEKARGVFANDEAIMHYERAAALAREAGATRVDGARPVDVSAGSIHTNLGDVLGLTGSESKAVGHYSFALRALTGVAPRGGSAVKGANPDRFTLPGRKRSPATRQAIGRICRKVGFLYEAMSAYRRAEEWFIGALSVLPRDSAADRALAYIGIAGIEQRRGSFEQSQKWCLRGIRSARRAQDDAALAHGYKLLGVIYRESGSRRRGLLQTQRALDTYRRMNDPAGQSDTLNNLGLDHLELGEWPQAVAALEECLSLAEKTGDLDTQAMAHNNLGEVLLSQGELAGAKTQFRWAVEAKQRLGYLGLGALAEANLGTAFMLEGRPEDAERTLQSSLRDFRRTGVRPFEVDVELRLAEVSFAEGKRERAQREAQKALRHAVSFGLTNVEEAAHRLLAKLAAEKRQWGAAQTHALTALRLSRRASAPYGEAKALAIIGSLYNQQAKIDGSPQSQKQAQAHYRRAINIFRRLGARLDAEAAERELVAN